VHTYVQFELKETGILEKGIFLAKGPGLLRPDSWTQTLNPRPYY
jgi:hypothetical protein